MAAIMRGLDSDSYDRQYGDDYLLRRIATYFGNFRREVIWIVLAFFSTSVVSAIPPILIASGVDILANRKMNILPVLAERYRAVQVNPQKDMLWLIIAALFLTAVIQYLANWVRRRLMSKVLGNVVAQMRKDAFRAAMDRDLAFYDSNKSGKIVSRITSDTQEFNDVVLLVSDVLTQLFQAVLLLIVMYSRSAYLTGILALAIPVIVVVAIFFRRLARIVTRRGARAMALVNDMIQETVAGISITKNFRQEAMIYDDFVAINRQSYSVNVRRGMVMVLIFPVMNVISGFAVAVVMYLGAKVVLAGSLEVGTWFMFIDGVDRFWFPFTNLAAVWSQFQQALSATERIFALIDADNTVVQTESVQPNRITGRVELGNVTFEYEPGQPVLHHFDLKIHPGESVAFVGHTGAGKSTIAKIIARFYEFQEGHVLIDGQDIRTFDLQAYRRHLGIVPQQPFLFSGTVRDNMRYACPGAMDDAIREVAYGVGNGEWLETLPEGLDTNVGERGSRLSMGQRQLVALMRVLLQRPEIFILDEATASVDPFTETQIQEALDLILKQSTSILIAHRLSTVRNADRIIVLREGGIIEQGDHDALMAQNGHYAELYNTYFRHQSLSYIESARDLFAGD